MTAPILDEAELAVRMFERATGVLRGGKTAAEMIASLRDMTPPETPTVFEQLARVAADYVRERAAPPPAPTPEGE